jgi:uncharacterized protein DUF4389
MATGVGTYPVRVEGSLDPQLSRWLWLVKWLLVIPHYVVLAMLWPAFVVLSAIAFFAILITGRYPRAIFDFNVGVLRWSWRVGFYAFSANGTDRYPPFTLAETDYPAKLAVAYPQELSRGLVLVKWWLLALPHYLVIALFAGSALSGNSGLIGLLVLIAAVALLFTGRYPRGIFDFVLGLDRWVLRVAAYAGLMTDRYPPFRLDAGGSDPSTIDLEDAGGGTGGALPIVIGAVAALLGAALVLGGAGTLAFERTQRDGAGFLMRGAHQLSTTTYAVVSETVRPDRNGFDWGPGNTVQIKVDSGRPVFVGIGPALDVDRYLAATAHREVPDLGGARGVVQAGGGPPAAAADQGFWVATTTGAGHRTLRWHARDGAWQAVVMNADGSPGVSARVAIGVRIPHLERIALGALGVGIVLLAGGGALLYAGVRRPA